MANGKSDGSIIVNTKIETSGFEKGIADAKKKIASFSNSLNKLGSTIKNTFYSTNTSGAGKSYDQLSKEIAKTENQLDKLIEKQIRFVETGGNIKSRAFAGMEYDIEMARNKLEELRGELANTSKEAPKKINRMKIWIDKLKNAFNSLNKSSNKSHSGILRMLATSLLFSTVFKAINAITKGFGEGINNISQYSEEANASMSALKSSMTRLKNSFASAFMPIITSVTPILTGFIDLLSKATSMVAAFFSALSGKTTYTKAIEVQEDYAASLDKTANSAKEAQKYLSGLDEIKTFTEKDKDKNGAILPENMFTEEEISTPLINYAGKIKLLIRKIKSFIKNEDWQGLGRFISDGIASALDFLSEELDEFDWDGLGEDVGEFLSGIDWLKVIKSGFKLTFNIFKAIAEVWFGGFKAAPIETAVITALALLSFGGVKTIFAGVGASAAASLLGALTAGFVGFKLGQWFYEFFTGEDITLSAREQFDAIKESFTDGSWKEALKLWLKDIRDAIYEMGEIISGWWNSLMESLFSESEWTGYSDGRWKDFDTSKLNKMRVPALANGAVIPPNAPFMAMLGDQRHGTNIEAPLDTIKQAVREVVGNSSGGGQYAFTAQINRRTIFEEMIDEAKLRQSTTGKNPFDLT